MSEYPWNASVRDPRHLATEGSVVEVAAAGQANAREPGVNAELINLSRQGMQIRISKEFVEGEWIETRFGRQDATARFAQRGRVLWVRPDDGQWLAGCQFETELDWEAMGELFANNLLET